MLTAMAERPPRVRLPALLLPTLSFSALVLGACANPRPQARLEAVPTSQVCVVRHGHAYKNLADPPPDMGPADLDQLTERGQAQATALGATLPRPVALIWTSPTRRTRDTARLLALPAPVEVVDDLRSLEGLRWRERKAALAEGRDPLPDPGESFADGATRARELLSQLRERLAPGQHAVLVTHLDVAAVLLGELAGTPLLERYAHGLATGEAACVPLSAR